MKNIILYLRKILNQTHISPPLGRWNIEKCQIKINNKIDRANEDHCGPCGLYKNKFKEFIKN